MFDQHKTSIVECKKDGDDKMFQLVAYDYGRRQNGQTYLDTRDSKIETDRSRPFKRTGGQIAYLDDAAVLQLIEGFEHSCSYRPQLTELFNMFCDEYCGSSDPYWSPAIWFSDESPYFRQFNNVREGFGNLLMYNQDIRRAFIKADQKNIPFDQCLHAIKDPLEQSWNNASTNMSRVVFSPEGLGKTQISVLKDLGWLVFVHNGVDFEMQ